MKERPIIQGYEIAGRMPVFQQWSRQAIRDDRKNQTRRVIKPQPVFGQYDSLPGSLVCPYGQIGDIRVMTEPLKNVAGWAYYVDLDAEGVFQPVISNQTGKHLRWRWKVKFLSSLFMPYEAARTLTRYTNVRVERLQEISEEDAIAKGMHLFREYVSRTAIEEFQTTWDFLNAKRGYPWESDPQVWVVEFEKVKS